jgi:flagellar hook-associated protein 2
MAIEGAKLDVNGIVSQLMSLEQRPIAMLNKKEGDYQAKISAYGGISGALSSFQTATQELSKPEKFKTIKATSADAAVVTVTATEKAAIGNHSISISSLAQAQKLVAEGQTSDTANIGSGVASKITFDFGSISGGDFDKSSGNYKGASFASNGQESKSISIDSGNNTLQGIRDAINAAKIGIKATIINDGSELPYTLALSTDKLGTDNSIKISVEGDEAISNLLTQDPAGRQQLSQTLAAQNATFNIDGVSVNSSSNSIADVIPGIALELKSTTDKAVSISVANDGSGITTSVQGFVKAYNDLNKTLQDLSSYNAATKQGAVLQGDSTVRLLQSQILNVLNTPITNTGGSLTTLSQIGISIQRDGNMEVDTAKLNAAINKSPADVASLFTTVGKSSDPHITYNSADLKTNSGSYPLNVTKLATHGSLGGCEEIESRIIEEGDNDQLNVSVNGVTASVTLAPGTYTFDSLANEIQAKINGASKLTESGNTVSVKHDEFGMIITSNAYGSKSKVDISGSGALNLFGKTPVRVIGTDVMGTINGAPAIGSGQNLTAASGGAEGVKILIDGGSTGERGKINYSQGYAYKLNNLLTAVLASDGPLQSRKNGINASIKDVDNHRDKIEQRLPQQEARYRRQYSTLETMLSNMSKTSSYLSQQLSNLPRPY